MEEKVNGRGREGKKKGKRRKSEGDERKERTYVKKNVLITQVSLQKAAAGWLELSLLSNLLVCFVCKVCN